MLNKLTKQQIADLRSSWMGEELYKAIRTCTIDICKASTYYCISAEQVFIEVVGLIDEMKSGAPDWDTLYERVRQDYHLQDSLIEEGELHLITSCILSVVFYISQITEQIRFNRMGEELMNQIFSNNNLYRDKLYQMMDSMDEQEGLSKWVDEYLQSDEEWSKRLSKYKEIQEEAPVIQKADSNIISKVMADKKTLPNGVVLYPQTLLKKAAEKIDVSAPAQLAILMEVAKRNEVIRAAATPTQFLKALIELRIVVRKEAKVVRSMATQIGTKNKALSLNTMQWSATDQIVLREIQSAFKTK